MLHPYFLPEAAATAATPVAKGKSKREGAATQGAPPQKKGKKLTKKEQEAEGAATAGAEKKAAAKKERNK